MEILGRGLTQGVGKGRLGKRGEFWDENVKNEMWIQVKEEEI